MRTFLPPSCALSLGFIVVSATMAPAQEHQLQPGALLFANGAPLSVGAYAIPCATDWNGDGRKDLLVGYRYADKIAVYLNIGTDAEPVFGLPTNLQASGTDIQHPSAGCGAPAPFACDFDSDGRRDLLVGTGAEGYVYFYRNTNTDAAPLLAPGMLLMVGGSPLTVGARATPYVYDWDGDGLNDLLCGDGNGYVNFFKNIGTAQSPSYSAAVAIQAGGSPLNLGARSIVRMCDWDGDGVKDLVGSSSTGVYWCRNVGGNSAPLLLAPVALRAPAALTGLVPINTGARMRLELVDWNSDGRTDLLVGSVDGTISYYEAYDFEFTPTCSLSAGRCAISWHSAPFLSYQVLAGPSPASATNLLLTNWASAGRTTSWTHTNAGPPWFYRVRIER